MAEPEIDVTSPTGTSKASIITHLFAEREHDARSHLHVMNPVDESEEFAELCEACRRGDVRAVRDLIQFKGVNLNAVDRFDYPPLTLASLCGHYDVVQLLLESGALCERDTFQGERCLYSALNDDIRKLLLRYDFSKSIDEKQPYASSISSLLTLTPLDTSDVTITTTYHPDADSLSSQSSLTTSTPLYTNEFHLHKFLLCARSQYFRKKLLPSGSKKSPRILHLPSTIDSRAFESLVRFLYLGEITEALSPEVTANIQRISRHLDLPALWEYVLALRDPKQRRLLRMDEVDKAQAELDGWFEEFVAGKAVRVEIEKAGEFRMEQGNETFADLVLRADDDDDDDDDEAEEERGEGDNAKGSDTSTPTTPSQRYATFFPVHKAMLRSEFFTVMFTSSFREGQKLSPNEPLQIIPLEITPAVLEIVLRFLYSDVVKIPLELALDTLYAADRLLIERLKTKTAMVISTEGNAGLPGDDDDDGRGRGRGGRKGYNVYDVIRAGWDTRQRKLEEFGAKYIAHRLEDYLDDEEFSELVQESAQRIEARQETDTIELIDDIRYYLDQRFRMRMDNYDDFEEMYDEDAAPADGAGDTKEQEKEGGGRTGTGTAGPEGTGGKKRQVWTDEEIQADVMRAEAIKFDELLGRIDGLLEKLDLDA